MLSFVGLGLYDERSITIAGRDALRAASSVFAEFYTSKLTGVSVRDLEAEHEIDIELRDRTGVEDDPGAILDAARDDEVVFLSAGDPMISTTHVDLRLRAHDCGIQTRILHAPTAQSAASSLTGLQNYRFGKATTLPFDYAHGADGVPESVLQTLEDNRERGLHTLVYLDIKAEREECMHADTAASLLSREYEDALGVVVARAGSPDPVVAADRLSALETRSFGDPLHLVVIPGTLHELEAQALRAFADAPSTLTQKLL